ncbi:hypothetical protein KKF32_02445 [Patescibacteria group bacterium]|nr:hypothetical protein [Patescibacteria group bacterium]
MKILVLGMDGNVLDNYQIKANCAGKALQKNAKIFFNINKPISYFANIYIETSGMNSLKQFKIAFQRITNKKIGSKALEATEKNFRNYLKKGERKIKIFKDAEQFFIKNKNKYFFTITTTVVIKDIPRLLLTTQLDKYVNIILARHGIWENNKIQSINKFDKGPKHYNYLTKRFKTSKNDLVGISSTKHDIYNAKKFGIISIGVTHIYNKNKLIKFRPDFIVENFTELTNLLKKLPTNK